MNSWPTLWRLSSTSSPPDPRRTGETRRATVTCSGRGIFGSAGIAGCGAGKRLESGVCERSSDPSTAMPALSHPIRSTFPCRFYITLEICTPSVQQVRRGDSTTRPEKPVFWPRRSFPESFGTDAALLIHCLIEYVFTKITSRRISCKAKECVMLVLTRKLQEKIRVGNDITITVLRVKGNSVRIGVEAPRDVRVMRGELVRFETPPLAARLERGCPIAHSTTLRLW